MAVNTRMAAVHSCACQQGFHIIATVIKAFSLPVTILRVKVSDK